MVSTLIAKLLMKSQSANVLLDIKEIPSMVVVMNVNLTTSAGPRWLVSTTNVRILVTPNVVLVHNVRASVTTELYALVLR